MKKKRKKCLKVQFFVIEKPISEKKSILMSNTIYFIYFERKKRRKT